MDGVYDSDPNENPGAKKFQSLSYMDALNLRLEVMDATALTLCMDNSLPIIVFDVFQEGSISGILSGDKIGTTISERT